MAKQYYYNTIRREGRIDATIIYKEIKGYNGSSARAYMQSNSEFYKIRGIQHHIILPLLGIEARLTEEDLKAIRKNRKVSSIVVR